MIVHWLPPLETNGQIFARKPTVSIQTIMLAVLASEIVSIPNFMSLDICILFFLQVFFSLFCLYNLLIRLFYTKSYFLAR